MASQPGREGDRGRAARPGAPLCARREDRVADRALFPGGRGGRGGPAARRAPDRGGTNPWAEAGHVVAWEQLALPWDRTCRRRSPSSDALPGLESAGNERALFVSGEDFSLVFDFDEARITSLVYDGREVAPRRPGAGAGRLPGAHRQRHVVSRRVRAGRSPGAEAPRARSRDRRAAPRRAAVEGADRMPGHGRRRLPARHDLHRARQRRDRDRQRREAHRRPAAAPEARAADARGSRVRDLHVVRARTRRELPGQEAQLRRRPLDDDGCRYVRALRPSAGARQPHRRALGRADRRGRRGAARGRGRAARRHGDALRPRRPRGVAPPERPAEALCPARADRRGDPLARRRADGAGRRELRATPHAGVRAASGAHAVPREPAPAPRESARPAIPVAVAPSVRRDRAAVVTMGSPTPRATHPLHAGRVRAHGAGRATSPPRSPTRTPPRSGPSPRRPGCSRARPPRSRSRPRGRWSR